MVLLNNKLIVMFHQILAIEFTKDREIKVLAQSQQPTVLENHQITSNSSYQAQYLINASCLCICLYILEPSLMMVRNDFTAKLLHLSLRQTTLALSVNLNM